MERADILYSIQERLIQDLGSVVENVKINYTGKLNNSWVFDKIGGLITKLKPKRVENVDYSREDLENQLNSLIDGHLGKVQKHVPEIKTEDARKLVHNAGELYDLIYNRAEHEVTALEEKVKEYSDAAELVNSEFRKSRAFSSRKEHEVWLKRLSENLSGVFEYIERLGYELANKGGLVWKAKLKAAKIYLSKKLGMNLDLPKLAEDVSTAKEAIIKSYNVYENKLISSRYV